MYEYIFWIALFAVFFSYALYPIVLLFLSGIVQSLRDIQFVTSRKNKRLKSLENEDLPDVTVVISAYNEQSVIKARIENLKQLDYPEEKIKFLIGSDGSQDGTNEIITELCDSQVQGIVFDQNRGKASVLNDLVARSDNEIIVFSDANTDFATDAVRRLASHFVRNPETDAVCGELHLYAKDSSENHDNLYWKYERVLKFNESRISGLLGANGAIYALRKSKYKALAADTIVDDFTTVFHISVNGGKVIYDPEAQAYEEIAPTSAEEYQRRIRIGSGNYQAFRRFLSPGLLIKPALLFTYFSHKVLRWHTPHLLLLALICSLILSVNSWFYAIAFIAQALTYFLSYAWRSKTINSSIVKLVVFWVNMNISLGLGAIRYYKGGVSGQWKSTER